MAYLQDVDDLVTERDNLQSAMTELNQTGITSYAIGGRTVTYEMRADLQKQINQLNRRIAARMPSGTKALGYNLADFSQKTKVMDSEDE